MTKKKKCVLIVEDNAGVLNLLSLIVKKEGFAVVTARDGIEALKLLESKPRDLMLLDLILPLMDGFEVLEKLMTFSRQVPVISFSSDIDLGEKSLKLGANAFIPKPFDPDRMVSKIRELLEHQ